MIRAEHIQAALALWEYTEASARYIFGDRLGDPIADEILQLLDANDRTQTDIYNHFGKHHGTADRIGVAIEALVRAGLVTKVSQPSDGGRPTTLWHRVTTI